MPDADTSPLRIALLGNVDPDIFWSTENEYVDAYERLGHHVDGFQEQEPTDWDALIRAIHTGHDFDFVHWTRTKAFADQAGEARQWELIAACRRAGIPLIGIHLDTWINLEREQQVIDDPYFRGVDILFTADGDADDLWERAGVNHRWLLPAISERWLGLGEPKPEYDCDVVFVGGWDGYGHKAWKHRPEMIERLSRWYGDRFLALPRRGQPRIVGRDLNDVYASAKVVVGDSCLTPHPDGRAKRFYCSDRIPESLGRGAYLLHPEVEGITGLTGGAFYDVNCLCDFWQLRDWDELRYRIDTELREGGFGEQSERQRRVDLVATSHTYTHRAQEVIDTLRDEGMLA